MSAQNNQIQQTYDALVNFVSHMKNQPQVRQQSNSNQTTQKSQLEQQCSYLQQVNNQLQVELVRYKAGYEKEYKDGQYRETVIADLNSKLVFAESSHAEKVEEYENRISTLKDKNHNQYLDIKALKEKSDNLRIRFDGLKEVVNKTRENARDRERKLEKELEEIKADAKRYRQERNELREKLISYDIERAAKKVKIVHFESLNIDPVEPKSDDGDKEGDKEILNEYILPLTPVTNTFPTLNEKLDALLSGNNEKVALNKEDKIYPIHEENLIGDMWFYTTTLQGDQKLAVSVNTFMWFSAISSSYSQAVKNATKSCVKLSSSFNNVNRQRIFLTGKGVVEVCKTILRLTGDEFSSQVERIISVVPFLVWDF